MIPISNTTVLIGLVALSIISWVLPKKLQIAGIITGTALFVGYFSLESLIILSTTTVVTYYSFVFLKKGSASVLVSISLISAIYVFFKINTIPGHSFYNLEYLLPLGISYYTFRQIHYVMERYKGKLSPHNFLTYVAYLFFLPTFLSGPIHRFQPFHRDLRRRRWDKELTSRGFERILYGYARIIIFGNYLVSNKLVSFIDGLDPQHILLIGYLDAIRWWMNLYYQFSGYSSVAIGFSLIMGFRIMENFDYPFLSQNVSDFWRRWHISLTSWSREYVYTPLASITRRPYFAVISSMLVIGIWHSVSLRYILWAIYHGSGIILYQQFERRLKPRLPKINNLMLKKTVEAISCFITLQYVILSFPITSKVAEYLLNL